MVGNDASNKHGGIVEISVVAPVPPRLEPKVAAHLILVQAPRHDWVIASVVSVFDSVACGNEPRRLAVMTIANIHTEHVLMTCNDDPVCTQVNQRVPCHAWFDRIVLCPRFPLQGRSSYSIAT